jgi:hypothetical protein
LPRHDLVDDVQAQAAAAEPAARGEEGLEDAAVQRRRDAAAVVAERHAHVVVWAQRGADRDAPGVAGLERVLQRVHRQVGDHLRYRHRIVVHQDAVLGLDVHLHAGLLQPGPQIG